LNTTWFIHFLGSIIDVSSHFFALQSFGAQERATRRAVHSVD
jgi:hypothetical protein